MCHDISFSANTIELVTKYLPDLQWEDQGQIDFNQANHLLSMSHRQALTVFKKNGKPQLELFQWGLIAPFMNTPEKVKQYRIQMANARSEKLLDPASAWYRIRSQRCLIAVDGFFEHRHIPGWKNKVPYYIQLKASPHFFLPGLYHYSPIPDPHTGEMPGTFTIFTRAANDSMKAIHNDGPNKHRMPMLMNPEQSLSWLNEEMTDEDIRQFLQYEITNEELEYWPVFTIRTTKPRPDGVEDKRAPFVWPELPAMSI
jgi:putative SOS response-associated peptidase YedK